MLRVLDKVGKMVYYIINDSENINNHRHQTPTN